MAYSKSSDLLTGGTPISQLLDKEKFVADAADEIDSRIGVRYVVPVDVSPDADPPVAVYSRLLLKRINNFLATGRLILAAASAGEDTELNAYAVRLITEAHEAITQIESGAVDLDGAVENPTNSTSLPGPTIKNPDTASAVDAFYDRVMVPERALTYRDWAPGDRPTGSVLP